ncbi:MAG: hypothetical protein OXB93_06390 [Cytophagales bacterium]|nr:hypothetical protein [Cytophagales bacterium]
MKDFYSDFNKVALRISQDANVEYYDKWAATKDGEKDSDRNEEKGSQKSPFKTKLKLFVVAACVGSFHNEFDPLENEKSHPLPKVADILKDEDRLALLAIAHKHLVEKEGNPKNIVELLGDTDKVKKIVEGYANGGIKILWKKLRAAGSDRLNPLVKDLLEEFKDRLSSLRGSEGEG